MLLGAAASAVLLAACGGGEEAAKEKAAAETPSAAPVLAEFTLREGDASKANDALAAMFLNESEAGRVGFGDSSVDGATATFSNVVITVPEDSDEQPVPISVGTLSLKGLDMTEAGASFAQLQLSDVSITAPEGEEGGLTVSNIDISNPSPELAAWVSSLFGQGEPAEFPSMDKVTFDAVSFDGLSFNMTEDGEAAAFDVGKFSLNSLTAEKLGAFIIEGVDFNFQDDEDQQVKIGMGSMSLSGADLGFVEALQEAVASGADEDEMTAAIMGAVYENPMDPGFDGFALSEFAVDAAGVTFDIPSLESVIQRNGAGDPVRFVTKPYKMTLGADPEGELGKELAGPLGMMGYETVEVTGESVYDYDPEADIATFEASQNYVSVTDGFSFRTGGKVEGYSAYAKSFANLDFTADEPDMGVIQEAVSNLVLHNLEFTLEDDSIVDRAFNLAAAQSGQDPAALRGQAQMAVGFLPLMAGESGVDPELLTEVSGALSSFLAEPGTLTLKLAPEAPISAASFTDPSQITKDALGFSATAE